MRGCLPAVVFAALSVLTSTAMSASTRFSTAGRSPSRLESTIGCCSDPDVQNFGLHLDFNAVPEDSELADQYRYMGILLGRGATSLAPRTFVRADYARSSECNHVLNGEPTFSGWEFMIFADSNQDHWAGVQKVGADIGYCDMEASCFLAAYDVDGNLIDIKFNQGVGFEFLSIERPSADICRVMVGDCIRSGAVCYPDQAGSALNCLTFSPPVSYARPLPTTVAMPGPPTIPTSPLAGTVQLLLMAGLLGAGAVWFLRRDRGLSRAD